MDFKDKKVVHITTVHHPLDPRIYYKECLSLHKAGFDVTLIVPEEEDVQVESPINILSIKKRKSRIKRVVLSTLEALKQARSLNADIYHIHDPELLLVAWLLKKKGNVVVYDIHEDYETSIMQKEYLKKPIRLLMSKGFKFAEKVLSFNLELCLAEKYYKEKYPNGECVLNYPIIEENTIKTEYKLKRNNNSTAKLIYTGNISQDRGAAIHAQLPSLDEKISVHFFGKCPNSLAREMNEIAGNKKDRLFIEGKGRYVPKDEIDLQYQNGEWLAGLALFPPTEHYMKKELTKFFEYMSAGLPIICSDFPAWKELVEKYNCGIAVNPLDNNQIKEAIEYLKNNPEEAERMGINGQQAVKKHLNWDNEASKLQEWYGEILERNVFPELSYRFKRSKMALIKQKSH
ncbi:glycosyl transferase [Sutcliffiella horikoshii]|uniref:Glycosyl transferase n=1 Tax=Sutcliffiella horikoshii TaxID=79883 RepID=A0ABM6KNM7_9BACI|nr:glycosyltransferase [Sutcliffiella horikoshii]ART78088.1 glycosyl transferase [Sutcliffiella horikoshii]